MKAKRVDMRGKRKTERESDTEKERESWRRPVQLQLDIQSDSSKNHQSLRFGDSKVSSISKHFPQPLKGCQPFICFGLM